MGENEELGWFPRYIGAQPICNDVGRTTNVPIIEYVGIDMSGKPIYKPKTSCGTIPKPSPTHAERMASLKAEMDAMAEKYKPIAGKLVEEIYERSQNVPPPIKKPTTHKPRKHYEPKFTL